MSSAVEIRPYADNHDHLKDELCALDLLIKLRATTLLLQSNEAPGDQVTRTVYISRQDVEWLLAKRETSAREDPAAIELRLQLQALRAEIQARVTCTAEVGVYLALPRLARLFNLSAFERQVPRK